MKKLLTAMLAVAMTVFMAMPAFAATSTPTTKGSITVSNVQDGKEYAAYKIFDVTYNGDAYSYTIDSTSPWFTTVKNLYTVSQVNGTTTYNVADRGTSAAAVAKALSDALDAMGSKPTPAAFVSGTASNLDLGYYFVTTTTGTVCSLTTTNPNATVVDKNEQPPFEKSVDDQDVEIGQELTYTITGKVPDTTGYNEYTYEVSDTMSAGLTYMDGVTVTFGDEGIDTTGKYEKTSNGFKLTFDMTKYQQHVGKTITITYKAKVNENAVTTEAGNPNAASLKYSNNPADNNSFGTENKVVKVYTCNINIFKHVKDQTTALANAKFKLHNADGKYYKWDEVAKAVTWVVDANDATEVVTDNAGKASFKGLEAGSYKLTETEAPAGYNKLTSDKDVKVTRTGTDPNVTITGNDVDVPNSTGTILPSTGDMGTKALYALGGLMAAGAAVALVARKRASRR